MANLDPVPPFGKKLTTGFAEATSREKNDRIARESLRDLMLFNNSLEIEMKNMTLASRNGMAPDQELFNKMSAVQEKYHYAMSGLKVLDDDNERCAFISLADAIQDLMTYIHQRRH
jgi:hypothetical protein